MPRSELPARLAALAVEGAGLLIALPLWIWWAAWKGGYPPSVFLVGIGYLAFAALALQLFAPRRPIAREAGWALGGLAVLSAWTLVSLLWAADRGAVEIAAGRQILLFGSFALPLLWPPSRRALLVGTVALPLVALVGALTAIGGAIDDPASLVDGRLSGPTGYPNASAALLAAGLLPALIFGSRRELPVWLRAICLAATGALLESFLLTQSRGGLAALALVLLLALLLVPGRLRLLIAAAVVAVAAAPTLDPLLAVRSTAVDGGDLDSALRSAASAIVTSTVVLLALGAVYAAFDSRTEVAAGTVRRASAAVGIGAGLVAAVGAIALLATGPDIGGWLSDRIDDFKTPEYGTLESESTRFTGDLGSNRYDYWRVSVQIFADHPLGGTGADNFIAPYLEKRHGDKSTIYSHSIWLGALAQLGAVGFLALLGFLVALILALVRAARAPGSQRWLVVAASLPLAYVLVHGAVDWIAVFPVVTAPALALAAAAAAASDEDEAGASRFPGLAVTVALVVATLLAAPLLVATRLADRGVASWPQRPDAAISDLERAASLDPLAASPYVRLGVVAVELGRPRLAREAFDSALQRDDSAWYPELQLGLLSAARGERARALRHLRVAYERNPREPTTGGSLRAVRGGRSPVPRLVQYEVLSEEAN